MISLTLPMVGITLVGVFAGSFMDAIAGGGGIITVPTFLLAGLPMHMALGTNKLSAAIGTMASTGRYIRSSYVNWKLGIPSIALALGGAALGTLLQLRVPAVYLQYVLLAVLPLVALIVLRQREFPEEPGEIDPRRQAAIVLGAALVVGAYDGFYGPGTGTFLLIIFTRWGKLDVRTASGNVKIVNLSSNLAAALTSILYGQVLWTLGLLAALASFAGHYAGSGLAIRNGSKIVRPMVLVALGLLAIKVVSGLFV